VVKYHRTIESYFIALKQAGFSVLDLREGTPKREHFSSEDEFVGNFEGFVGNLPVGWTLGCFRWTLPRVR